MTRPPFRRLRHLLLSFTILFAAGVLLGQTGIPVEDGGEVITVARLGGTMHPPGMPLLALLQRVSWILGERGPAVLAALCASVSLLLLFRRSGAAGLAMALAVMAMPSFRERVLAWDAYGLMFLLFSAALASDGLPGMPSGYLTGLSLAVHPAGVLMPAALSWRRRSILAALCGLLLGASIYLALPVMSAAGCAVDWGSPGVLSKFIAQVSAAGYREVYGASMGNPGEAALLWHLSVLRGMLWPAFMLPVAAGTVLLALSSRRKLLRLGILLVLDAAFILLVNPMASGTSQTGWLSLLVLCSLAAAACEALPQAASLALAAAVALPPFVSRADPLPDQTADVEPFVSAAPLEAGLFISDNDLLYGCWVEKYGRDLRPDMVLLSTGNFSPWFERLARRYNTDLDTSGGLNDVGGPGTPREVVVARLIEMTIRNNPQREFFSDR